MNAKHVFAAGKVKEFGLMLLFVVIYAFVVHFHVVVIRPFVQRIDYCVPVFFDTTYSLAMPKMLYMS